jgi:hypothetical protein
MSIKAKKYQLFPQFLFCLLILAGCSEAKIEVSQSTLKVCDDMSYSPPEGEPIPVANASEYINAYVTWWQGLVIQTQEDISPEQFSEFRKYHRDSAIQDLNRKAKNIARTNYEIVEDKEMASLLEQIYDYQTETRTDEEIYEYVAPIINKVFDICQFRELAK